MNLIIFGFASATTIIIILVNSIIFFERQIPFIGAFFRYGRVGINKKENFIFRIIFDVPKAWYKHFYKVAVITFFYGLYITTSVYIFNNEVPTHLFNVLNTTCGEFRTSQISATHVYVAMCLLTLQVFRRFYDTHNISVFGKYSYMNFTHYLFGMFYYPAVLIALLSEAPKFTENTEFPNNQVDFSKLNYWDYFAIVLFLWAWYHQHTTTKILGNLRKNEAGYVVTNDHKIPYGDWFEYISSPHQTAEILMYTALSIILAYHISWFFVYVWVLTNQIETMLLTHWWYISKFKNYPKKRKALIPYMY